MENENGTNINQKSTRQRAAHAPEHPRASRVDTAPSGRPTAADLAAAFSDDDSDTHATAATKTRSKAKKPLTKLRKIAIAVLSVGVIALVAGIGFLVYQIVSTPNASDADFLVQVKTWQREDAPSVIWEFSEVGKGSLTNNDGTNVYDFTWAFADGKLKIDTDWLYTLNDEYDFSIDQHARTLTLRTDDQTLTFVPAESSLTSNN